MEGYKEVLSLLEHQCSKREYCSSEVFQKALKHLDYDRDQAQLVLDSLIKDKYVDDLRYAGAFARDKAYLTGWGPVKIRYTLVGKGISRDLIDEAISDIDEEKATNRMKEVIAAKYRTLKGDATAKLKLIKFALTRGYEYDQIYEVINELITNN